MSIAVKERPILMSSPMVRAILEGRKTQTRRVVKPQPPHDGRWAPKEHSALPGVWIGYTPDGRLRNDAGDWRCPFGTAGDRLWVRETWALVCNYGEDGLDDWDGKIPDFFPNNSFAQVWHKAGHPWESDSLDNRGFRWRPSIFMPRWASRITLEITGVRVERLQEISEADKLAEGATPEMPFGTVWRQINTTPGIRWEDDPFCWVIEFRRIDA